jgi:hypothetical protein
MRKPTHRRRDISILRGYDFDGSTFGPFSNADGRFDALTDDPIPQKLLVYVNGLPRISGQRQTDRQFPPYSIYSTYDADKGYPNRAAGDYTEEDQYCV